MVSNKAIRAALYTKLNVSAVTTLLGAGSASLVHALGGPKAVYPLCAFYRSASTSTHTLSANAYDSEVWVVKAVTSAINAGATPPSASVAEDIDAAARTLLDQSSLTISGATSLYLVRENGMDYQESQGDQYFHHVGAYYRVMFT